MNNIVSKKIPNIFSFLLEVKSIDDCIKYFNENISQENKEKIKIKNFKINNKKFLNIAKPFFKEESKPTMVLGNLHLPKFHTEFERTLFQELKNVKIPDLIHKHMFELTVQNIVDLFRLFVLPLFIKCFLPLTYSYDSYSLLYTRTELDKYMKNWKKIIDYEHIPIPDGLKIIVNLIIENDKNKFSESDSIIIKKFKDYLSELKNKDLSKLYVYFGYDGIEVNFLDKHILRIIDNIIKGSTGVKINRIEINYIKMIQFFFILFLIDNFELFIHLQNFFIEIQKECNFNELYILYYKLKYIEENVRSINQNALIFYTSVYDYLVYKLYLHIQGIVEPVILDIIKDFELKYTFVDRLIEKQLAEERNYKLKESVSVDNSRQQSSLSSPPQQNNSRQQSSLSSPPPQYNSRQQSSLSSHPPQYNSRQQSSLSSHPPQYNSRQQSSLSSHPPQYNSRQQSSLSSHPPQYNSPPPQYNSRQQSSLSSHPPQYNSPPPPYNSHPPPYNSHPPPYNSTPPPYERINQFPILNFRRKK